MPVMSTATDIENPAARRARQRREAARRSREYRDRMKRQRAPEVRIVEGAIVEAVAFVLAKYSPLARAHNAGLPLSTAAIPVQELLRVAADVLCQAGYDRKLSNTAIADLTASRPEHRSPANIPSLRPTQDPARRQPTKRWPGDPPAPVIPYQRRYVDTNADVDAIVRGLLLSDCDWDDEEDA